MKRLLAVAFALALSSFCSATTIHVPADQPTIQAGINASDGLEIEWSKTFVLPDHEEGIAVIETTDKGFATLSQITRVGNNERWTLVCRYNMAGDTLWTRLFSLSRSESPKDMVQMQDGGFCVVGFSDSVGYDQSYIRILRLASDGGLLWIKKIERPGRDMEAWAATLSDDGFVVLVGTANMNDGRGYDIFLAKLNANGDTLWTSLLNLGSGNERAYSVVRDKNYQFALCGGQNAQYLLFLKVDSTGLLVNEKVFNEYSSQVGRSLTRTRDGGYALFGYAFTGLIDYAPYIIKLDSAGERQWSSVGESKSRISPHRPGCEANEYGFIYTADRYANTHWSSQIGKYSKNGQPLWLVDIDSTRENSINDICPTTDSGYVLFGSIVGDGGQQDPWLVKIRSTNSVPPIPSLFRPIADGIIESSNVDLHILNANDSDLDAVSYDFEVYLDTLSGSPVAGASGVEEQADSTEWTVMPALSDNNHYFWRARAFDGYEYSPWSPYASFWVNAIEEPPTAFDVISPSNSGTAQTYDNAPIFSWGSSSDPDPRDSVYYTLRIGIDSFFLFYSTIDSIYTTQRQVNGLQLGWHYWWKASAHDTKGNTTWSSNTAHLRMWVLGDTNMDGSVNVGDVVFLINLIFKSGPWPIPFKAGDVNGDCAVNIGDAVYLINHIFKGGLAPKVGCAE